VSPEIVTELVTIFHNYARCGKAKLLVYNTDVMLEKNLSENVVDITLRWPIPRVDSKSFCFYDQKFESGC